MCYDISFATRYELITQYVPDLIVDPQIGIDYDAIIHTQAQAYRKYPVIIMQEGRYHLKPFEWGIIADYMTTPEKIKAMRNAMCNARSEKIIGDKKSIWRRLRQQRCLIPVTGIMEHREIRGWKNKVPYHVWLKDRNIFCIPGLYHYSTNWADKETGEIVGTYTLVTRAANSLMMQIHNSGDQAFRMPLFLPKELELKWLEPDLTDEEIQQILDYEMPSEMLQYETVWTIRSQKERPDNKGKLDAFEWPNLPPLGEDEIKQNVLFS